MEKNRKEEPISPAKRPMFLTWSNAKEKSAALHSLNEALHKSEPIVRSAGSNIFMDIGTNNTSVRDGYSRRDYEDFRPEESLPNKPKSVINLCMQAYETIGIVKNIIDLMADFATQGINLVHPNERIEKWYKEWFRRVRGKERSERFTNLLYRTGNVIVKRNTANISVEQENKMRSEAKTDVEIDLLPDVASREIPWKYTFYNPLSLEVVADELSVFVGQDNLAYAIKVPTSLTSKIKTPKTQVEKALVKRLPPEVAKAIKNGDTLIPLNQEKVRGFYYKRDDWKVWATPMVSAILADLHLLQKMKLADLSALDGAISCIRVWKLGDLTAGIMPTEVAISRLSEMLCNNVGGGVMDLVWDCALSLEETSTDVHQFLGSTKYEPVLTSIYAGLGIPATLTGANTEGGFNNNFISLKTLTERLQYGRDILADFWNEEIRIVQKAMGFRFPATLTFDRMTLSDEAAEKQLLISLADRDIISWESIVERFDEVPEIEEVRLRREHRKRVNGQLPEKAGPYHSADKEHDLKKSFVNQGIVTPSQVGIELDPNENGEKTMMEQTNEQSLKEAKIQKKNATQPGGVVPSKKPSGTPGQGRPMNKRDTKKRKTKRVVPRTSAVFFHTMAWAENAQGKINQITSAGYLKSLGKKTLRELTDNEATAFEKYKFFVLCQLEPNQTIDEDTIVKAASIQNLSIPSSVDELLKQTIAKHVEMHGKEPTFDVLRRYQAGAFAFWKGEYEEKELDEIE